jgi:hypothetical protein
MMMTATVRKRTEPARDGLEGGEVEVERQFRRAVQYEQVHELSNGYSLM